MSPRRSPHGERGLKLDLAGDAPAVQARRSPHGERGLKLPAGDVVDVVSRRSPHGERGLKLGEIHLAAKTMPVAPPTGSVD